MSETMLTKVWIGDGGRDADRAHRAIAKAMWRLVDQGMSAHLVANVMLCEAYSLLMGPSGESAEERKLPFPSGGGPYPGQVERARKSFGYFMKRLEDDEAVAGDRKPRADDVERVP